MPIIKFFLNVILFIPRLILSSIAAFFKVILLIAVIMAILFFWGQDYIKGFFAPSNKETKHSVITQKDTIHNESF